MPRGLAGVYAGRAKSRPARGPFVLPEPPSAVALGPMICALSYGMQQRPDPKVALTLPTDPGHARFDVWMREATAARRSTKVESVPLGHQSQSHRRGPSGTCSGTTTQAFATVGGL